MGRGRALREGTANARVWQPTTFTTAGAFTTFHLYPLADVWSAGCVLVELIIGRPLFPGESGVDQLVEIIKVLGTPTKDQIEAMNPNYRAFKFPQIRAHPWAEVCSGHGKDGGALLGKWG